MFDEALKTLYPLGPVPSPAQNCLIYLLHLLKEKAVFMQ